MRGGAGDMCCPAPFGRKLAGEGSFGMTDKIARYESCLFFLDSGSPWTKLADM